MLKNKTRAHAPEPKMATVEKHAPRNYVAFKNIKSLKEKLKEELKEFKEFKRVQESTFYEVVRSYFAENRTRI